MTKAFRDDGAAAMELRPKLISRLLPWARSRDLAEEIADEAILRVTAREHLRTKYNVWPWLLTISLNLLKDNRRRQGVRNRSTRDVARLERFRSPLDDAAESELVEALDRALMRLSRIEREAFVAVHLDGLTCRQAAAALGRSEYSVRAASWHAKVRLQSWLRAWARAAPSNLHKSVDIGVNSP